MDKEDRASGEALGIGIDPLHNYGACSCSYQRIYRYRKSLQMTEMDDSVFLLVQMHLLPLKATMDQLMDKNEDATHFGYMASNMVEVKYLSTGAENITNETQYEEVIPSSKVLSFVCLNTSLSIPLSHDPDKNLYMEVLCSNGDFIFPNSNEKWPSNCSLIPHCSINSSQSLSNNIIRLLGQEIPFRRVGEYIHYQCMDGIFLQTGNAILSKLCESDLKFHGNSSELLECQTLQKCKLPEMSPGLEMTPVYEEMVAGDAGKLGCIKPFHHIEGKIACHNLDNVRMFERDQFVIPKRDICGSFNTQSPNKKNQCSCTKVESSFKSMAAIQSDGIRMEGFFRKHIISRVHFRQKLNRELERVDLVCHNDTQTLKGPDIYWDSNSTDGRISLVCRTNGEFQSLPNGSYSCVATCSMDVPMPSNESGLYLKDRKPDVVFEGELIRFECQNSSLALQIFDGSGEIDSNKDLISILCGPDGRYNITKKKTHDEFDFPTCLPRAKKCTCLGDIEDPDTAMSILEKYLYGTPGHISKDTTIDSITKYVHEVITPTKNRKGTIDLQNVTKENECTCRTYQNQGTRNSIWFSVEILNLPWKDEYLRLKDKKTIFAKGLLDKMVNEYLYSLPELRNAGYVRSEIFQFLRGSVDLIEKRKGLNPTRRSVIHSDLRIISNLNNQEEIGNKSLDGISVYEYDAIKRCNNDVLGSLAGLGFNHDNYITGSRKLASEVQVGSTVNLICNNPFQIIAEDVLDHDPTDNKITIECLINGKFNFPNMKDLPECKAYCEDNRHPAPPTYSGLVINQKHLNKTKYWKDDYISYLCKDQKLGVNGADESEYRFYCLTTDSHVAAQFHFPNMKKNETWPICETKTTTVPPVIIKAIDNAKKKITGDLIRQITADQYYHEKYSEDPNYLSSITIPFFFCLLLIFIGILYILRLDNPFLKLKSDS
ncbi:unnamed protein product [Lepeophtheirus salmonis]|uniref:(salmon louse) hypothetical protein n=1 Tax=Lepeophtheirus salmonis TaxID=72036 RepID=A0A7R8CP45_LEPSM|nr:unnamed protein product [Lepeophtheirus salmonis]CAF2878903.1 unnamed protein product [Lepeophtheirus salmonis]